MRFVSLFAAVLFFCQAPAWGGSPFLPEVTPDILQLRPGEEKNVTIAVPIPENYFLYQEKTSFQWLQTGGLEVVGTEFPAPINRFDPFFKKEAPVFVAPEALIYLHLRAPPDVVEGELRLEGLLQLQGCSDKLCYPPETHLISLKLSVSHGENFIPLAQKPSEGVWAAALSQNFGVVLERGFFWGLLVVFLAGVLTSLTPCVLPLVPMTLLVIGVKKEKPVWANLGLSFALVLGIALMYSSIGLIGVFFGKTLGFFFQSKIFIVTVSLLLLVMAAAMFDLFTFQIPPSWQQRLSKLKTGGGRGAFLSGLGVGIFAAPCAGPLVGALLLFVATTQNYLLGFLFLFVYAIGIGLLFLVLGTGFGSLQARLKSGKAGLWIKKGLGVLLVVGALYFLNSILGIDRKIDSWLQGPAPVAWENSIEAGLEIARRENKPVLVDFYAEWCAPCKEMEYDFFRRPEVVPLLRQMIPVRFDATFTDDPQVEETLRRYNITGMPTVLFLKPDGTVLEELRVVSYDAELLLDHLRVAASSL